MAEAKTRQSILCGEKVMPLSSSSSCNLLITRVWCQVSSVKSPGWLMVLRGFYYLVGRGLSQPMWDPYSVVVVRDGSAVIRRLVQASPLSRQERVKSELAQRTLRRIVHLSGLDTTVEISWVAQATASESKTRYSVEKVMPSSSSLHHLLITRLSCSSGIMRKTSQSHCDKLTSWMGCYECISCRGVRCGQRFSTFCKWSWPIKDQFHRSLGLHQRIGGVRCACTTNMQLVPQRDSAPGSYQSVLFGLHRHEPDLTGT